MQTKQCTRKIFEEQAFNISVYRCDISCRAALASITVIIVFIMTILPAKADEKTLFFSAEALVEFCGAEDESAFIICPTYVRGVLDGISVSKGEVCVGYDVFGYDLSLRILHAAIQFRIMGLSEELLLGLPPHELNEIQAADFVRWSFISSFENQEPKDYRCSD